MIFLSGLAPPLGLCRGGDLCGLYSALSQDGKLVVGDIPLVVWGLCFGKVGRVISCLFGPVRGYRRMGPQCLSTLPVSSSSIYAAVVYLSGARVSLLYLEYFSSYPVSCVNLSMLSLILSLFLTWPCCCSSFNCSACGYGTLTCSQDVLPVSDLLLSTL